MSLQETILNDLKTAMKAKEATKVSTLRMLNAAIKNKKIELGQDPEDADIQKVAKSLVKQRKDAIQSYQEGGRDDLAQKEQQEIEILKAYLPEEMSQEEVDAVVEKVVEETGASGMQDMGKVMGVVMKELAGKADGNVVKKSVQSKLNG